MSLAERVKELIQKKQVTPYEISVKTGVSQSTLSRIINNATSKPNIKNIEALANYFHVSKDWLLSGIDSDNESQLQYNEVTPVPEGDYMMVEYVDLRASAGRLGVGDVSQLPDTHKRLVPKEYAKGGFLVVRIDGDSMDDGSKRSLSDGDEVLIYEHVDNHIENLPIRKTLFVITTLNGNVLKQIKEINKEESYILCHSFNPDYEDFKIKFEDVCQIFIVCKVVQKQISLI